MVGQEAGFKGVGDFGSRDKVGWQEWGLEEGKIRWADGLCCPHCGSAQVNWKGCPGGTKPNRPARRRGLKKRGRGNRESDKVPVVAIVQRDGQLPVCVCQNLQQETFRPWLLACLQL